MRKAPFVVSLVTDLRPVVTGLNRVLLARGAEPVRAEELPEVDRMLHDGPRNRALPSPRCPRCGGYVYADALGDHTCLNCGRAAETARRLEEVIQQIAQDLLEWRREQAGSGASGGRRAETASLP